MNHFLISQKNFFFISNIYWIQIKDTLYIIYDTLTILTNKKGEKNDTIYIVTKKYIGYRCKDNWIWV